MPSMLDAALDYAARGWPVFPCKPKAKVPWTNHGCNEATTDEATIRDWWRRSPTANVAIVTGERSGLYVIDVDAPNSEDLALLSPTLQARTPRRGWHYFYSIPPGAARLKNFVKAAGHIGKDTDGRGEGGYVVAYPSVVEVDGAEKQYEWCNLDAVDIAPLPQWIIDRLVSSQRVLPRESYAMTVPTYGRKALEAEAAALASTGEGGRNDALNRATFRLAQLVAGGHLSQGVVEEEMMHAARACGLGEREAIATIRSGMASGLQHPRHPTPRAVRPRNESMDGEPEVLDQEAPADVGLGERAGIDEREDQERWSLLARVRALGGLCDTFAGWVVRGADHAQPGLTIAATLALGAVVSGRRLSYRGATSSLFLVSVAPSGDGKNRPQACVRRVIGELWGHLAGPNTFSSSASLTDHIRDTTDLGVGTLMVVDEYGMQLRGLLGSRVSAHRADIKQLLTELATIGTGTWAPSKSRATGGGSEHILAPSVSMLGSTTPESLHGILGGLEVADGFVGRHLWFSAQNILPPWQPPEARGTDETPIEVRQGIERLRAWHEEWHANLPQDGISATSGKPMMRYAPVEVDGEQAAAELLTAYKLSCDSLKRSGASHIPRAVLGRSPEYATRVAIGLAAMASPELEVPVVTRAIAEVAIAIADASADCFSLSLARNAAPDWHDPQAQAEYVVSRMRDIAGSGELVTRASLLRATRRMTARQLDDVIDRLIDEGRVAMQKETGGRGRPSMIIRLM